MARNKHKNKSWIFGFLEFAGKVPITQVRILEPSEQILRVNMMFYLVIKVVILPHVVFQPNKDNFFCLGT